MAENAVFYIKIIEGNNQGEIIQLEDEVVSLGSDKEFSVKPDRISFADATMATEHAVLIWQKKENTYMVSNRSPISPIVVNGSPCGHAFLAPGMVIKVGSTALEVSVDNYSGPSETAAAPAVLPSMNDLYLGEMPDSEPPRIGTPAWLLKGAVPETVDDRKSLEEVFSEHAGTAAPDYQPAADSYQEPVNAAANEPSADNGPKMLGQLQVIKGANRGEVLDVFGDVSIGRLPECDLVLSDAKVSRQHCVITFEDGMAYITNLSSSNTTKVGRIEVKNKKTELPADAEITLASCVVLKWTAAY